MGIYKVEGGIAMKKIFLTMFFLLVNIYVVGCTINNKIKEYKGIKLDYIEYSSTDYNGGVTTTYIFDFKNNVVKYRNYIPNELTENEYEIIKEFTEDQESILINRLYSYGFFNIKERYNSPEGIIDGGGWNLEIHYEDGSNKLSTGSNNSPKDVFNNCAKAFYDICGDGIVGYVGTEYYAPPTLDCSLEYYIDGNRHYYGNKFYEIISYSWNGFTKENNDASYFSKSIFENIDKFFENFEYNSNIEYIVGLNTLNYKMYGDYSKFKKCIVKSYEFNEEQTDEKIILEKGWFNQIKFKLEINRIYIITLTFQNGDYVEYAFNTNIN